MLMVTGWNSEFITHALRFIVEIREVANIPNLLKSSIKSLKIWSTNLILQIDMLALLVDLFVCLVNFLVS